MSRALVLGAGGQLGQCLRLLEPEGHEAFCASLVRLTGRAQAPWRENLARMLRQLRA